MSYLKNTFITRQYIEVIQPVQKALTDHGIVEMVGYCTSIENIL